MMYLPFANIEMSMMTRNHFLPVLSVEFQTGWIPE